MLKRLATLLCCLPLMVSAAQVTDLYQGRAPTSGDMTAAQSQALGEVLVKVTGKRDILTQPVVVKALAAPADYVKSYGYQDQDSVKYLKAEFKSDKVNSLVSESQFALLGPARPQMAIWLVVDQGERRLLADQLVRGVFAGAFQFHEDARRALDVAAAAQRLFELRDLAEQAAQYDWLRVVTHRRQRGMA